MLLTLVDNAVLTGVICLSLKLTGSAIPLGLVLCLSVVVPFLLGRLQGLRGGALSFRALCVIRVVAFVFVVAGSLGGLTNAMAGFLAVALAVGIANFFTVTVFEGENARLVVGGRMSAWHGARWFQTALQLGTCVGDMAGGGLLDRLGAVHFVTVAGVAGIALSIGLLATRTRSATGSAASAPSAHSVRRRDETSGVSAGAVQAPTLALGANRATALLVCISLFGLHIGAFNSMVPVVFLQLKGWNATFYGLAAGLVGIGALAAVTVFARPLNRAMVAVLFMVCDVVLVLSDAKWLVLAAAVVLGYLFNYLRMHVRERLLASARNTADADWVGSCSAYASLLMQSFGPLAFTLLLGNGALSTGASPWMLIASGVALVVATSATTAPPRVATALGE